MQRNHKELLIPEVLDGENPLRIRFIPYNARLLDAQKAKGLTRKHLYTLTGIRMERLSAIVTLRTEPTDSEKWELADALEQDAHYLFPERLMELVRSGAIPERRVAEFGEDKLLELGMARMGLLKAGGEAEDETLDHAEINELHNQLMDAISDLSPREQTVIILRFGLDGHGSRTLEEAGRESEFGVTRERIRQIEAKALRKLRNPKYSTALRDWLEGTEKQKKRRRKSKDRRKQTFAKKLVPIDHYTADMIDELRQSAYDRGHRDLQCFESSSGKENLDEEARRRR